LRGGLGLADRLLLHRQRLDQLDDGHGRVVATAVTDLGDAGVATGTVLVPRADLGEERVDDALVRDHLEHLTAVVKVALLRLGDQTLGVGTQLARLRLGGGDAAVLEERLREVREEELLVRGAAAHTGTLGGPRHSDSPVCLPRPYQVPESVSEQAVACRRSRAPSQTSWRTRAPEGARGTARPAETGRQSATDRRSRAQYCSVSTKPA